MGSAMADVNERPQSKRPRRELGRVRTALLAMLAGSLAVVGAYYTSRNFALNRQGQITERFTRAVDQLGNEHVDVRLGGIYALERLARESREDYGPIVEILTAYVREHAPSPPRADATPGHSEQLAASTVPPNAGPHPDARPSTDVQAVLTVLRRRGIGPDTDARLDLRRTVLSGADLRHAQLEGANLMDAHLKGANLMDAHLKGAILGDAHLKRAVLVGADLEGAYLIDAHLEGAILMDADLEGANLAGAHLEGEVDRL